MIVAVMIYPLLLLMLVMLLEEVIEALMFVDVLTSLFSVSSVVFSRLSRGKIDRNRPLRT